MKRNKHRTSATRPKPNVGWLPRTARLSLVGAIAAALSPVSALEVTGSFSGFWNQPDQQNHGLILQITSQSNGSELGVGYWAFYDQLGNEQWLYAEGAITGDTLNATLFEVEGVTFLQPANPDLNPTNPVGTMQIQFTDCNTGNVGFDTPTVIVGTGGFKIQRLANQPGLDCSGGIADNVPPSAVPESFDIDLLPTGVYPDASGDVEFELSPGDADLDIDVEGLPVGDYIVQVGGITRGTVQVEQDGDDTEGELEFSSPLDDDDELLLDFDPRGEIIDILEGSTVVLTTVAPAVGTPPGGPGSPTTFGQDDIELELSNEGVYPDGEADADLDVDDDGNRAEFEVDVEDIPVGSYIVQVGGVVRGQIQVTLDDDDEPEGDIEFDYPGSPGALLLDFDPRGQLIEVLESETVLFSGTFPTMGIDDDDDDDDDGSDDGNSGDDDDDDGSDDGDTTSDIDVEFNNSGVFEDGDAEASYNADEDSASFDISVSGIPAGSYSLVVDGIVRGTLIATVDDDDDEAEGDLSFSNPIEDDDLLLDFDPRGTLVEIVDGETQLFFIDFPVD